jgi:hypothetical protein
VWREWRRGGSAGKACLDSERREGSFELLRCLLEYGRLHVIEHHNLEEEEEGGGRESEEERRW